MIEADADSVSSDSRADAKYKTPGLDPITGKFARGNKLSKGNVLARRVARIRAEILRKEDPSDVHAVIAAMRSKALEGDATAAKVYLDRVMGPVTPMEIDARIEGLESQIEALTALLRAAQSAPQVELRQAG